MNLICPKCNHKFNSEAKRPQCSQCRYNFPRVKNIQKHPQETSKKTSNLISDDIMQGNILDALNKADINPTNHRELFRDAIPLILKEDKLKFAFAEACQDRRRSPEIIIRNAVRFWLKEKGYLK